MGLTGPSPKFSLVDMLNEALDLLVDDDDDDDESVIDINTNDTLPSRHQGTPKINSNNRHSGNRSNDNDGSQELQ